MIAYITGKLFKQEKDKIVLLSGHVGYEILLPSFVMKTVGGSRPGDELAFYIYYHQTERQPKPVLIGFNDEIEKAFFQLFISVDAIGPLKAVKALDLSISEIAAAIESGDAARLKQLKGIGARTAQKIIASLSGRMEMFVADTAGTVEKDDAMTGFAKVVMDVLVNQLGYKQSQASTMIAKAMQRNDSLRTAEDLFDEAVRGGLEHE